ncbi:sensor domain-containing diguanylate cyclase [Chromobacterium paludis]|uniref:Sensor domain-containing diguanylate cyclase n=1 Tax=Chromobacterium paludis TaxID=2605945 RepID=A0A5C1DFK3_9NEIS|nr:sensor domain-containing diguanylate cyclase [Chromobacterium paludis]QEL54697.1 sensor domain-containing diguanylate cyclase [Chromobacterium paludis]
MTALQTLQPLIDTVQGCLVLSSPDDGRIMSANQLASILLACPHDELMDRSMYDFLPHEADAAAIRQDLATHSMIYNRGMQLRTVNGRHFDVQLSVRRVKLNDDPMLVFSFSDRTEAKVMGQLLDFERQLVQRSLNIVKTLKEEGSQNEDEDRLTGVAGMHRLMSAAHAETGRVLRYGGALSILALTLVNAPDMVPKEDDGSAYNHLLRLSASLCQQSIRDSDLVARRGDNAFLILLPSTDMAGASELARRLITSLRQLTFLYQGSEHQAEACVGLSTLRPDETGPKAMLERLEIALFKAREGGANYVVRLP